MELEVNGQLHKIGMDINQKKQIIEVLKQLAGIKRKLEELLKTEN